MKRLAFVAAAVLAVAACSKSENATPDTTPAMAPAPAVAPAATDTGMKADTAMKMDTSAAPAADTTKKAAKKGGKKGKKG